MGDDIEALETTWANRELRILKVALRRIDAGEFAPPLEGIRLEIELDIPQMRVGVRALETAQPPYLTVQWLGQGPNEVGGFVVDVSERARRELGTWPSSSSILDALVRTLHRDAEDETEPEEKSRLKVAAEVLGGVTREVFVGVISKKLGGL